MGRMPGSVHEKDDILPRAVVAIVKGPLLGDFVNVLRRVVVIDQVAISPCSPGSGRTTFSFFMALVDRFPCFIPFTVG